MTTTTTSYTNKFKIVESSQPAYTDGKVCTKILTHGGSCIALIEEDHTSPASLKKIKNVIKTRVSGKCVVRFGRKTVLSCNV